MISAEIILTLVIFIVLKKIGFSEDSSVPEAGTAVIENKLLANSVLESIIGKGGVSPVAKQSLASRLSALFNDNAEKAAANGKSESK